MPDDSHNRDPEPGRPFPHGRPTGYDYGCRLPCCREAKYAYELDLRERKKDWNDVDEVAVERACKGDLTIRLTPAEMQAAFTELNSRGLSAMEIARRLGVTQRTIVRWRTGKIRRPLERRLSA
jgi:DNA-directed RNA polymerase specialized sigma24 family protein